MLTQYTLTGEEGSIVSVVSNWNAATSAEPHCKFPPQIILTSLSYIIISFNFIGYYKHHKDSVLQEFLLPEGQYVKGIFRVRCYPLIPANCGLLTYVQALAPQATPHKRNRSISISSGAEITASHLPGFFLWTSDTIYECRQNVPSPFHCLLSPV